MMALFSGCGPDPSALDSEDVTSSDPLKPDAETKAYRQQLQQDYDREEWASHPQYVPKLTDQAKSPDGKWYCWVNNITPCIDGYEQATYDEIHVKSGKTEYQLDGCEYGYDGRSRWLSTPVFSADSKRVAVFERDELGTGDIFIWTLETGKLKKVTTKRGDLERIYSDKKGIFRIGPERAYFGGFD
ncbi:MAG: hypothetical protein WCG99_04035 [Candidatus Berkelbacteria bacterium]